MPSYSYLIPYANQHAFENRAFDDATALDRFVTAIPGSLSEDLRSTLLDHYMAARARAIQGVVIPSNAGRGAP